VEQKSFRNEAQGELILIPTPIGNLEDMTFRAIRYLKEVDLIAAEDTRQTRKLCTHFDIQSPLVSYHEHNKMVSGEKLISQMKEGLRVGLVTDAGTPGISDPGQDLVRRCIEEEIPVIPLPGACAATTALIASGLPTDHFLFYGFLPRQKKERQTILHSLKDHPHTLIFYEAPHRLKETLQAMAEFFADREVTLARELTKRYETFVRGSYQTVMDWALENEPRGECCLVVEGQKNPIGLDEPAFWDDWSLSKHVDYYQGKGLDKKEAIKKVATDRELSKREVYNTYHQENDSTL
jgi:16S rRNA (cytidine1402-2'-O)-methyltransferase